MNTLVRLGALSFGAALVGAACGGSSNGPGNLAGDDSGVSTDATANLDGPDAQGDVADELQPEASADASAETSTDASPDATVEASSEASADGAAEGSSDASSEASADGSVEASSDAPAEGMADVSSEAAAEAGASDAGDGGTSAPVFIVVDQFGYRTSDEKMAVLRKPQTGFDAPSAFTPGSAIALIDAQSTSMVLEGAAVAWNSGATDPSSGDKAWRFDFSSVTTPGSYYVLDEASGARSDVFRIADDVYGVALTQSQRMFYYQRDGLAKTAQYAGATWVDNAAHAQDVACGLYSDGSGQRDLHGGWFGGGDENKYAGLEAGDIVVLLRAYSENPSAFHDDTGIPESGNGIPDILDEVKWGLDWLARMQGSDGSVLSIVSHACTMPPSADTSPCSYGSASTSVTFSSAAAFAYGALVLGSVSSVTSAYPGYASGLSTRAQNAWTWAVANPAVYFFNLGHGLGGREQEVDAAGLVVRKVQAATFLFELTHAASYQTVVDGNYTQLQVPLDPFSMQTPDTLLEYAATAGATAATVTSIIGTFKSAVEGPSFLGASQNDVDPYFAPIVQYSLGSNKAKAGQGNMLRDISTFNVDPAVAVAARGYAERYIHYLHGVNPLGVSYLSNMGAYGAQQSVQALWTCWFEQGWPHAPPPGFLAPGPNPAYTWDPCCPSGCGSAYNNSLCGAAPLAPPAGQPDQKSYRDISAGWPLDGWLVSEPTDDYQAEYIRLLSKFAP